ncbi:MAG TPA: AraC family transcriptional regulator [Flavobacterium sp.]|nr:AraC family transcriptional regulator [Flavobacterium sp.]
MKFKSKILGQQDPIIVVETGDSYNQKSHFTVEDTTIKEVGVQEITIRNLITEGVLIFDSTMFFSEAQTIQTEMIGEAVVMNFICSNNLESDIDQVENEKYSTENTHNILYTSKLKATFKIPALQEINCLSIILSPDFYSRLINEDWGLHKKFSRNIKQKKTGYLTPKYAPFNAAIQWVLHEIKSCTYEGTLQKMYIESKIKELLIFQLDSVKEPVKAEKIIDDEELSKLLKAKLILEEKFTNAPSLSELSRLISLNEFKLKKGFKACFQTTIKSYVIQLRMEYAKNLFKNKTANVSEVAEKCGYKDVSHFSSAFKLFYGFTPASFRKNHWGANFLLFCWEFIDVISVEVFMV